MADRPKRPRPTAGRPSKGGPGGHPRSEARGDRDDGRPAGPGSGSPAPKRPTTRPTSDGPRRGTGFRAADPAAPPWVDRDPAPLRAGRPPGSGDRPPNRPDRSPNRGGPPFRGAPAPTRADRPPNRGGSPTRGGPPSHGAPFRDARTPDRDGPPPRDGAPFRGGQPFRSGPGARGPRGAAGPWRSPGWQAGPPRPPGPPPVALETLVGLDDELVAGRRPVEEAFTARREARRLLVTPQRRQPLERLVLHATNLRIPIVEVEGGTLTALAGFDGHQGIALVVAPRHWASLDDILARAIELDEPPFILVLDSLEDPQNVGTLMRSAEAAGVHGVVYPTRRQAPLSPAAIKASAGAVEHLLLCPVDDLPGALADLHGRGLRIAGAEAGAPMAVRDADLRGPLALVVGSEGQGIGPAVRRRCDVLMRIPMRGVVGSLNAAVAGSVLLFEALAQRGTAPGVPGTGGAAPAVSPAGAGTSDPPAPKRVRSSRSGRATAAGPDAAAAAPAARAADPASDAVAGDEGPELLPGDA